MHDGSMETEDNGAATDNAISGEGLLTELMAQAQTDIGAARERLAALVAVSEWRELPLGARRTLSDLCFLEGDFAAGYAALRGLADSSLHLSLATHLGQPHATASQAFRWAESGPITTKGIRMINSVFDELQNKLDDFHAEHGVSMLVDFWRRLSAEGSIDEVAAGIEDDVLMIYTGEDVRILLERGREDRREPNPPVAFEGWPEYEQSIDWPAPWIRSQQHYGLIRAFFRCLLRDAENAAREAAGIPRVGERWPSEMKLLKEIRAAFPGERVVHQARPWWLKPQSLDIYFTDHNIGIEYQGKQHSKPVDFFGGQDAFEHRQQRDLDKAGTCQQNGCTLIEVHPGYQLDDVVARVTAAIEKVGGPAANGQ